MWSMSKSCGQWTDEIIGRACYRLSPCSFAESFEAAGHSLKWWLSRACAVQRSERLSPVRPRPPLASARRSSSGTRSGAPRADVNNCHHFDPSSFFTLTFAVS